TVVLVTHFMDEAEHLCDRIAVVDKGRISAQGSPQELVSHYAPEIKVSFGYNGSDLSWLERTPDVLSVARLGDRVEVRGERAVIFRVASALAGQGLMPGDFRVEQPSLDDVFLKITGGQE